MAEGRMLKKRIAKSTKFANLNSDKARLLYLLLLPHVDCEGKMEANSDIIKGNVCPYIKTLTKLGIAKHLKHLHESRLIILYSAKNELYLQITRFEDFNRIDKKKEADSHIPSPTPAELQTNSPPTPPEVKVKLSEVKVKEKLKVEFPEKLNTPEFQKAWGMWEQYRTEKKKKLTPLSVKLQFEELAKYPIATAIKAIYHSIRNNYQGIFPESVQNGKSPVNQRDFADQTSEYGQTV